MATFSTEKKYLIPGKAHRSPAHDEKDFLNSTDVPAGPIDLSTPKSTRMPFSEIKNNLQCSEANSREFENVSLQFCDNKDDVAEDEIFFGQVTELEKKKARKFHKRRTVVFFPGFRKDPNLMRRTVNKENMIKENEIRLLPQSITKPRISQPLDLRTDTPTNQHLEKLHDDLDLKTKNDRSLDAFQESSVNSLYCYSRISGIGPLDLTVKSDTQDMSSDFNNARLSEESQFIMTHDLVEDLTSLSLENDESSTSLLNKARVSNGALQNSVSDMDTVMEDSHSTLNNARYSVDSLNHDSGYSGEVTIVSESNSALEHTVIENSADYTTDTNTGEPSDELSTENTLNRSFIENSSECAIAGMSETPQTFSDCQILQPTKATGTNIVNIERHDDKLVEQAVPTKSSQNKSLHAFTDAVNLAVLPAVHYPAPSQDFVCTSPDVLKSYKDIGPRGNDLENFSAFSTYTPTKQTVVRNNTANLMISNSEYFSPTSRNVTSYCSPSTFFPSLLSSETPMTMTTSEAQPQYSGSLSPFKKEDHTSIFTHYDSHCVTDPLIKTTPTKLNSNMSTHQVTSISGQTSTTYSNASKVCELPVVIAESSASVSGSWTAETNSTDSFHSSIEKTQGIDINLQDVTTASVANNECKVLQSENTSSEHVCPASPQLIDETNRDDQSCDVSKVDGHINKTTSIPQAKLSNHQYMTLLEAKKAQLRKLREEREKLQEKLRHDKMYGKLSQLHSPKPKKTVGEYPELPVVLPKSACVGRPALTLNQKELDAVTKLHTICNSKQVMKVVEKHHQSHPATNAASPAHTQKLQWRDDLVSHTPGIYSPSKAEERRGRPILSQRLTPRSGMKHVSLGPAIHSVAKTRTLGKEN